ncbi:MAG: ATP synthase F1 subunit epsilon [Bacteroidetes bacterium]|nr:ATP synthase F1 subunit epsilon [Bacteroidota bacterium]
MAEKLIQLDIVSPVKTVFSGKVTSITAPGELGGFQVLYRHAPMISSLKIGTIKIATEEGKTQYFAISSGILEVKENKCIVLADAVETQEEIDLARAEQALRRAEEILAAENQYHQKEVAKIEADRARNRIKLAKK